MENPQKREIRGKTAFSGLLYHGSSTANLDPKQLPYLDLAANYQNTYIGSWTDYGKKDLTSATLGPALYTTPERDEAVKYASIRAKLSGDSTTLLYQLDTLEASFFDFSNTEGQGNGCIPIELAKAWQDYYMTNINLDPEFTKKNYRRLQSYAYFLKDFIDRLETNREFEPEPRGKLLLPNHPSRLLGVDPYSKRDSSLRDLLRSLSLSDTDNVWSPFGGFWVRFVEDGLKCEGVTLLEGGEGEGFKKSTRTHAIYDLSIVKNQHIQILSN